jgi:hypothetical protein
MGIPHSAAELVPDASLPSARIEDARGHAVRQAEIRRLILRRKRVAVAKRKSLFHK